MQWYGKFYMDLQVNKSIFDTSNSFNVYRSAGSAQRLYRLFSVVALEAVHSFNSISFSRKIRFSSLLEKTTEFLCLQQANSRM